MPKANYEDLMEIFNAISMSGGNKASAYFTPGGIIRPCSLNRDVNWEMWIDYLPVDGYSRTAIREEILNRNIFLLKHLPLEYSRAVFWNTEKSLIYVNLQSMEEHNSHIVAWENRGYYCVFKVKLEHEENLRECHAIDYGKTWVFLDPET